MASEMDRIFLRKAYEQAIEGLREGGRPIGSVLVENGEVIAAGRNRSNQTGDMTAHAEVDCLRDAGPLVSRPGLTLYTTMAPCPMCAGAVVFLGIHRVVVGDTKIYPGYLDLMREHDVEVIVVDDPDCFALAEHFRDG
jgi:cytosine deaminase